MMSCNIYKEKKMSPTPKKAPRPRSLGEMAKRAAKKYISKPLVNKKPRKSK